MRVETEKHYTFSWIQMNNITESRMQLGVFSIKNPTVEYYSIGTRKLLLILNVNEWKQKQLPLYEAC